MGTLRLLSIETAGNLYKRVIETLNTRAFPDATHVLVDTESQTYPERVERAEQLRKEYSLETAARRVTGLGTVRHRNPNVTRQRRLFS